MLAVCQELKKNFTSGEENVGVLKSLSLEIDTGESVGILGPSGSGKTTLLRLLSGILLPDVGKVFFEGRDLSLLKEKERDALRLSKMGIVFQDFHLLNHLNALENVELPLRLNKAPNYRQKSLELLDRVGLSHRKNFFPKELSGGERQRVAIARALSCSPLLILADEPSGSLDASNGDKVMRILFELLEESKSSMVLVTHNESLGKRCQRCFLLRDGLAHRVS